MKQITAVLILIGLGVTAFGRRLPWTVTQKPPVSITTAVQVATKELNKDGDDFYCLSASVGITESDCDWQLRFFNTTGTERRISVAKDLTFRILRPGEQ